MFCWRIITWCEWNRQYFGEKVILQILMIALRITLSTDCHYFLCLIKEYLENSSSSFFSSLFSFIRVFLSPLYFYLPFFPCFVMSFSLLLISLLLFLFYFHISSCPFSLLFFSFSLYILFLLLFFFCSIPPSFFTFLPPLQLLGAWDRDHICPSSPVPRTSPHPLATKVTSLIF